MAKHVHRVILLILIGITLTVVGVGYTLAKPRPTVPPGPNPRPSASLTRHLVTFGMAYPALLYQTAGKQITQLKKMKQLGIGSVRFDANWASVQPTGPLNFDWARLDQAVKSARSAGISVDLILDGCPPWAAAPDTDGSPFAQPASSQLFAMWAARVARRYAPKGVHIFEIWNEPNIKLFWRPRPNPEAYTADLIAAYSAIKAVDPSAFIITGGMAPVVKSAIDYTPVNFMRAMYRYGAKGYFDAVGYHPYSFPALPNTPVRVSGWSQMNYDHPSIRGIMKSHGDSGKQIWITEFGAPSAGPAGVGPGLQAAQLIEAIRDTKATTWIGALYIYTWEDSGTDPLTSKDWFGLLRANGAPKPAYMQVGKALRR